MQTKIWDVLKTKVTIPDLVSVKHQMFECPNEGNKTGESAKYYPATDSWYCHKCRQGGDVISLYQIQNRLYDRREAIVKMAAYYDVPFNHLSEEEIKKIHTRDEIFEYFTALCETTLRESPLYEEVKKDRGFIDETMQKHRIGLVNKHVKQLLEDNFSKKDLIETGFLTERGTWCYDHRIVYPYLDGHGKAVYFIYRLIKTDPDFADDRKYIKHMVSGREYVQNEFYGLNSLHDFKSNILIITEGVTDAISVIQAGYPCLSPVTIRFKVADFEKIIRYCKRFDQVIVINDNEENEQGLKGALASLGILLQNQIPARIGIIPNELGLDKIDLDDYLQADTAEERTQLLTDIVDTSILGVEYLVQQIDIDQIQESALMDLIQYMGDDLMKLKQLKGLLKQYRIMNASEFTALSKKYYKQLKIEAKANEPVGEEWYLQFDVFWEENYAKTTLLVVDWDKWVVYENGFFKPLKTDDPINKIVFDWLDVHQIKASAQKYHLAKKRIAANWYVELSMFDADLNIRNVKNGLLSLDTLELKPHTYDYLSLRQADVNYLEPEELLPTPCWNQMRATYPIEIQKIEWFIRCIIYNNMTDEKALYIVGVKRSGKGTVCNVVTKMFPPTIASKQSMELIGTPFGLAPMAGKNLNIDKEGFIGKLNSYAVKYYKSITGMDGELLVNPKGSPQFNYDFVPFFFIVATNQLYRLPPTDVSAFFSRGFIAVFDHQQKKPNAQFKMDILLEVDSIFSKLVHQLYEPFPVFYKRIWGREFDLDEWVEEVKELWEQWAEPIDMLCRKHFTRAEGLDRMNVEDVAVIVEDLLLAGGYGVPQNHALKAQITKSLKRQNIKRAKSNTLYYYQPITIKDPDILEEWRDSVEQYTEGEKKKKKEVPKSQTRLSAPQQIDSVCNKPLPPKSNDTFTHFNDFDEEPTPVSNKWDGRCRQFLALIKGSAEPFEVEDIVTVLPDLTLDHAREIVAAGLDIYWRQGPGGYDVM